MKDIFFILSVFKSNENYKINYKWPKDNFFFHFIGSSIKWNTFTRFYVGLSNHVTDGVPIENRNGWIETHHAHLRVFVANKIMA